MAYLEELYCVLPYGTWYALGPAKAFIRLWAFFEMGSGFPAQWFAFILALFGKHKYLKTPDDQQIVLHIFCRERRTKH